MKCNFLKIFGILVLGATLGIAALAGAETSESGGHESKGYRIARFFNYYMMDYLDGDESHTLGLETLGEFELGSFEVDHRLYLEVADYPVEIEGKPYNPSPEPARQTASTTC